MQSKKGERPIEVIQPQSDASMSSDWRLIEINIDEDGPFKIILEVRQGRGRLGSVSLAGTKMTKGSCPDPNLAKNNVTVSGYQRMNGNCPGNLMPPHLQCKHFKSI